VSPLGQEFAFNRKGVTRHRLLKSVKLARRPRGNGLLGQETILQLPQRFTFSRIDFQPEAAFVRAEVKLMQTVPASGR